MTGFARASVLTVLVAALVVLAGCGDTGTQGDGTPTATGVEQLETTPGNAEGANPNSPANGTNQDAAPDQTPDEPEDDPSGDGDGTAQPTGDAASNGTANGTATAAAAS